MDDADRDALREFYCDAGEFGEAQIAAMDLIPGDTNGRAVEEWLDAKGLDSDHYAEWSTILANANVQLVVSEAQGTAAPPDLTVAFARAVRSAFTVGYVMAEKRGTFDV